MTEDDERLINSLEFRLSRAIDDSRRAQTALTAARHRLGLYDPQQIYTADEVDAIRAKSRAEEIALAVDAVCDWRAANDPTYRPGPVHAMLLHLFAPVATNVVPLRRK